MLKMKKVIKNDERRRPTIARRNSSSKPATSQSNTSNQSSAPRRLKNKLYICGLSPTVLREELIREFGKFGKLHDVWVAKKPPGFAFVEYINSRDAERVVHELDDTKVLGSKVRIEFAKANKGVEDSKKPKKTFPLSGTNPTGNKLSNKPTIAPLMGQLIVPSLLSASLGSSLSLLGSPPVSALVLPNLASYKRSRSSRDNKRYRGDSGSRWEQGLRKPISPLMKRFSRSPVGRGRMLSPPPKRSMIMPPSPFSRLSRNQRSIPSLLPPPPSRGLNASPPSKLMRLSGAILDRYSRSPLRAGSLRRLRRSLSRTYARSPMRNWTKINPLRTKRITGDKFRRSISPLRNRSLSHQRKTLSHGKERSASPRRNFVKSQVRSVKRANNNSRSISRSPYDGRIHRHESPLKDGRDAPDRRESWSSSPARSKKQFSRSFSSDSKSVSRTPNRSYKVRRSRSSSKNSVNCEGEKINRRQSPSEGNASFHRRSSASSHRRNSLSLRRNFYQSPGRGYSRDQSPPLNFVRTRLLGRTPPSPPVRNSKTPEDVGIRNVDARPKSASKLRNRSNERRSKSRSYDYRHSSVKSGRGSAGRTSRCESFASSGGDGLKSGNKNNASFTSSQSSSRSTSSSCSQNIEGHHASSLRSPEKELDKSKNKRYAKQIVRKGSAVPELMHNRSGEKRSHSVDSSGIAKKKVCLRSKGGPRSPPGSPELKSEIYSHAPSPKDVSPQKRSLSSKSRNSNCPSDRSHKVSTGRKTPLAYQCPRESISPPARKREFLQSRSPLSKSPHHHSMRKDAKARPIRHTRENSKHARHVPHTSPSKEPDRFKRDFSRCPPAYHDRSRSRYFKSPPPPMDHRHFRALDEMSMRLERSRPPYYNDHHVDTRAPNYYRRADYLGESEKGYYRRLSPPTHLPPPPPPQSSYPYRRVSDIPYQRSSRIRCEDLDQYYRTSDPFRGRIHNPPIIYRSGTNPVYSRQRPYRR